MTPAERALIERALVELPNVTAQEMAESAGGPMTWDEAAATKIVLSLAFKQALATGRKNRLVQAFLGRAKKKGIK